MSHLEAVDISQDCVRGEGKPHQATGYLRKNREGVGYYAHRLAYMDAYGAIPEGLQIHHACDNKLCINPKHLQALTKAEHQVIHSRPKAAEYYANLTRCRYGHPLDGRNKVQRFCITCHKKRNRVYHNHPAVKVKRAVMNREWKLVNRQKINEQQRKRRALKKELTNVLY